MHAVGRPSAADNVRDLITFDDDRIHHHEDGSGGWCASLARSPR
jgi:hypothetical protein